MIFCRKRGRSMQVDLKDAIYLITYLVSLVSIFLTFKGRLMAMESEFKKITSIIYAEKGSLNLVDVRACKEHRDQVFTALRRNETAMEIALTKIEILNENVLEIMIHLQIRREKKIVKPMD